jgi:hypothetical protein
MLHSGSTRSMSCPEMIPISGQKPRKSYSAASRSVARRAGAIEKLELVLNVMADSVEYREQMALG